MARRARSSVRVIRCGSRARRKRAQRGSLRLSEEGAQVFADSLVQERFLWLTAPVARDPERPAVVSRSTGRVESCADAVHCAGATSRNGPTASWSETWTAARLRWSESRRSL